MSAAHLKQYLSLKEEHEGIMENLKTFIQETSMEIDNTPNNPIEKACGAEVRNTPAAEPINRFVAAASAQHYSNQRRIEEYKRKNDGLLDELREIKKQRVDPIHTPTSASIPKNDIQTFSSSYYNATSDERSAVVTDGWFDQWISTGIRYTDNGGSSSLTQDQRALRDDLIGRVQRSTGFKGYTGAAQDIIIDPEKYQSHATQRR